MKRGAGGRIGYGALLADSELRRRYGNVRGTRLKVTAS
jgi:hypothetical protein